MNAVYKFIEAMLNEGFLTLIWPSYPLLDTTRVVKRSANPAYIRQSDHSEITRNVLLASHLYERKKTSKLLKLIIETYV